MALAKPGARYFSALLTETSVDQISIEAAQPNLDLAVLSRLGDKAVILGVIDLADMTVETPQIVADRIRLALAHVPANRVVVAPDCGMKYLPRTVAFAKMKAMAEGAALVRRELNGA